MRQILTHEKLSKWLLGYGLALVLVCSASVSVAAQVVIDAHRAVYDAELKRTDGDVTDIRGRMVFEWQDACTGWGIRQHYVLRFYDKNGGTREINTAYDSWEDKAGSIYRFKVKHLRSGSAQEELEGFANQGGTDSSVKGQAVFTSHDDEVFDLPVGTIFPSNHTISLIRHALSGKKFLTANIFDGSQREGSVYASAAIGQETRLTSPLFADVPKRYWPVRLAFFDADVEAGLPSYEFGFHLHPNGVMSVMKLHYKRYTIALRLVDYKKLPPANC